MLEDDTIVKVEMRFDLAKAIASILGQLPASQVARVLIDYSDAVSEAVKIKADNDKNVDDT